MDFTNGREIHSTLCIIAREEDQDECPADWEQQPLMSSGALCTANEHFSGMQVCSYGHHFEFQNVCSSLSAPEKPCLRFAKLKLHLM